MFSTNLGPDLSKGKRILTFPWKKGGIARSLSPWHESFPPPPFDGRCPHVLSPGSLAGMWWHGTVGLFLPRTLSRWWDSSRGSPSPCPGEAQPPDSGRTDLTLVSTSPATFTPLQLAPKFPLPLGLQTQDLKRQHSKLSERIFPYPSPMSSNASNALYF